MTKKPQTRQPSPRQILASAYTRTAKELRARHRRLLKEEPARAAVVDIRPQVFLYLGRPLKDIRTAFNNAKLIAALDDVWFHDLGRSFVTRKLAEGWDRDYIKTIIGHVTDKVLSRYNKPSAEQLALVVNGPRVLFQEQISAK